MPDPVWDHRFPLLKDQFPTYKDWPLVDADEWNNATWQNVFTALGAMEDYFINYFRDHVCWGSIDGWVTTIDGGGSVLPMVANIYIATGAVATNRAFLRAGNWYPRLNFAGRLLIWDFCIFDIGGITNVTAWFFLTPSNAAPPVETADHIGWKIINADLYASNGDGAVQKITDTTFNMPNGVAETRLRIVLDPGVDCKFYVNGVLKITHTVNLPVNNDFYYNLGVRTDGAAARNYRLSRLLLEQAY